MILIVDSGSTKTDWISIDKSGETLFETQIIGSAFVVSLQYTSDSTDPPFSLDAITLEYATNTRR